MIFFFLLKARDNQNNDKNVRNSHIRFNKCLFTDPLLNGCSDINLHSVRSRIFFQHYLLNIYFFKDALNTYWDMSVLNIYIKSLTLGIKIKSIIN